MTNPLEELLGSRHGETKYQARPGEHLKLEKLHALFCEKYTFEAGDIVEWKPGLRNKGTEYKKPLIVTKVYQEPIINPEKGPGSPYFNEPLDVICSEIDSEGDFIGFHYDSRRLQPYSQRDKVDG